MSACHAAVRAQTVTMLPGAAAAQCMHTSGLLKMGMCVYMALYRPGSTSPFITHHRTKLHGQCITTASYRCNVLSRQPSLPVLCLAGLRVAHTIRLQRVLPPGALAGHWDATAHTWFTIHVWHALLSLLRALCYLSVWCSLYAGADELHVA